MKINAVSIQGFRSFSTAQILAFDKLRPGLYHLAGKNEVEPELEGNGAGKSSLLEAICWGLYGRTSRNIRSGSIKNWQSKERCEVILEVETVSGLLGIYRAQNPNKLEVAISSAAPKPVDQQELDVLLGLPAEAFLFSVYFGQFSPAFIDMQPGDQMGAYSTVLGLNVWEEAAEAAGKQGRALEAAVAARTQAVAGLQGQLQALREQNYDAAEKEWLEGMERKDKELNASLEARRAKLKIEEKARTRFMADAEKAKAARAKVDVAARAVAAATGKRQALENELTSLTRKDLKNCPTCGALLKGNEHIKKEIAKKRGALDDAQREADSLALDHKVALEALAEFKVAEGGLIETTQATTRLTTEISSIELMIKNLEDEVNPYDKLREENKAKVTLTKAQLAAAEKVLSDEQAKQTQAVYWARGFKELRLSLIEESLAQLAIESNASLLELGLRDWSLSFDVERETKKGTISRGFSVMVQAPHVREPVQWVCWSGGESQRLRVASSIGFAELIASRMGLAPNVELWDEPSTWLSAAGINDLLSSLSNRAIKHGKVILVADHRVLDFGGFAGTIEVVKTNKGSEIRL